MGQTTCTISRVISLAFWSMVFAFTIGVLPHNYAHAYLDPGSGSFILQIIIAGVLGALFSIRIFWGRIIGVFKKSDPDSSDETMAASEIDLADSE